LVVDGGDGGDEPIRTWNGRKVSTVSLRVEASSRQVRIGGGDSKRAHKLVENAPSPSKTSIMCLIVGTPGTQGV